MSEKKVSFESKISRSDTAEIIEALVAALREGQVKVQRNDDVLVLSVPEVVDIEIEASIDDKKAKFEIEIEWPVAKDKQEKEPKSKISDKKDKSEKSAEKSKKKAKEATKVALHSAQEAFKEVGKIFALSGISVKKALKETVEATKTAVKDSAKAAKEMAEEATKLLTGGDKHEKKTPEKEMTHPTPAKKQETQKSLPHNPEAPKALPSAPKTPKKPKAAKAQKTQKAAKPANKAVKTEKKPTEKKVKQPQEKKSE